MRAQTDRIVIRPNIRRWFHLALRRRDRWERDVEDEIRIHLALRAEQLMTDGASADDAHAEAVRRFGPLAQSRARLFDAARRREHRMHRAEYLADLRQDIVFAFRTLGRQKMWSFVTVLTLALGIGATTAVFSVVNTVLLHPLPYPDADRIVHIGQQPSAGNTLGMRLTVTPPPSVVRAWMRDSRSFESFQGTHVIPRAMKTRSGEPSSVRVESTFPTFAEWAGARPMFGRMFTQNDVDAHVPVVVLSERFWRERLARDQRVLGQRLTLGDSVFTVVGVMPASFQRGLSYPTPDLWIPIDVTNDDVYFLLMGRLRPGVSPAVAARELDSIYARTSGLTGGKIPLTATVRRPAELITFRESLMLLSAVVTLVLLVACANVGHLLLSRAATRRREMAIRTALGAGRGRLLRQLLTESSILTLSGAVAGVSIGGAGLRVLVALRPQSLGDLVVAHVDLTTLALAAGVAIVTGVIFAVVGAAQAAQSATNDALKNGGPATGGRRAGARAVLVVSEMALSTTLVVVAALLIRSMMNLQRADLGFEPRDVYAISVPLQKPRFLEEAARAQALTALMSRLRSLPSIQSASVASVGPGSRRPTIGRLEIEGEPPPPIVSAGFIDINMVERSYFTTLRMKMREGTTFTDTSLGTHQVIVNEGFARTHWRESAIGHRIRVFRDSQGPWFTIVGVVADARVLGPLAESTVPMLYVPRTSAGPSPTVLLRTTGGARMLAEVISMMTELGIEKQNVSIERASELMARSVDRPRFVTLLLMIFTALGLILAAVGLYGVMAYTVAEQTREIGIRVALGATTNRIAQSVIGTGVSLAVVGAVLGLALAAWGTRVIEKQLYGIAALDLASFVVGALVLIATAFVACLVPTRRALTIDPMTAIRND